MIILPLFIKLLALLIVGAKCKNNKIFEGDSNKDCENLCTKPLPIPQWLLVPRRYFAHNSNKDCSWKPVNQ